mmetsp:Transcript_20081/g.42865  ORF Transcript_20081/g.42865 Transcript_20081/m.42865 type:complete len:392 (+) Transcript_20081:165-1340(+)
MACSAAPPCMEPWHLPHGCLVADTRSCGDDELRELRCSTPRSPPRSCAAISEALAASGLAVSTVEASPTAASPRRADEALRANLRAALGAIDHAALGSADEAEARELLVELLAADVPAQLLGRLGSLGFESRKDAMWLFKVMLDLAPQLGVGNQLVEYVSGNQKLCQLLIEGCGRPELALHHELALRACVRHPELEALLLKAHAPQRLLDLAGAAPGNFYASSEALACLRELLLPAATRGGAAAEYVEAHFSEFFQGFHGLLITADYAMQRQSLKLLGEMLLDPTFTRVMQAYVREDGFLRIHMDLLRDSSSSIRLGAFHVFKIFVANPFKTPRVLQILCKNRRRLLCLLAGFSVIRENDDDFVQDHSSVVLALESLTPLKTESGSPCASL